MFGKWKRSPGALHPEPQTAGHPETPLRAPAVGRWLSCKVLASTVRAPLPSPMPQSTLAIVTERVNYHQWSDKDSIKEGDLKSELSPLRIQMWQRWQKQLPAGQPLHSEAPAEAPSLSILLSAFSLLRGPGLILLDFGWWVPWTRLWGGARSRRKSFALAAVVQALHKNLF